MITLVRCGPGVTVQDLGRRGRLHEGLPPSGALVPELLRAANEALGNAPVSAGLEVMLHSLVLRAEELTTLSINGRCVSLAAGETLTVTPAPEAVAYVALPGGVDVPERLGSRSTLVSAQLGGIEGRGLRAGDRIRALLREPVRIKSVVPPPLAASPIRLVPGPDSFPPEALMRLLSEPYAISRLGDRTGVRLEGPRLPTPSDRPFSAPMIRGAVQVTHDGTPVVLGPDHPVTGGYPVIAAVVTADLGRLARHPPGARLLFTVESSSSGP